MVPRFEMVSYFRLRGPAVSRLYVATNVARTFSTGLVACIFLQAASGFP